MKRLELYGSEVEESLFAAVDLDPSCEVARAWMRGCAADSPARVLPQPSFAEGDAATDV